MLDGRGPLIVVEIQVPDEELVRRVASRRDLCELRPDGVGVRRATAGDGGAVRVVRRARWWRGPTTARRSCAIG